jgi:peptide/nickel transport system ATP-binding protein
MALLEVRDLTVEYHTSAGIFRAVEDLSLHLEQGGSLGIVGESGCGKTTAMLALMRLLPEAGRIVGGQVLFDGTDLLALSPTEMRQFRWEKISMVFQGAMNALNPVRTVGSQIEEALLLHSTVPRSQAGKEVARLLDTVGVSSSRTEQYPHQYSGGMRQRAMIAMALACRPKLVIADEPTTALDVMVQAQILDLLQELQRELDLSIIMVTHDLGVVAEICDDEAVHPYTRRLLLAFPDIDHPGAELASIPGHPPPLDNLPPGCRFEPRCGLGGARCAQEIPQTVELAPKHLVSCLLATNEGGAHGE